jgi:tRNA nucleotidyltransferase (CCA-adding enzyme)
MKKISFEKIVPEEVKEVIKVIETGGFQAYIVGGCVRDFLMNKEPEDWDIATNAHPEQTEKLFQKEGYKTFNENSFGTVGVVLSSSPQRKFSDIVEITTYRKETNYIKRRKPEKVEWAKTIEEDLSRRDFTVNAIAFGTKEKKVDPFNGQKDLKNKTIRAVGDPKERFSEDALRMLRAVRFTATLGFKIEEETKKSIKDNSDWIKDISKERIRDELIKIVMDEKAAKGIDLLRELGLLKNIIPELEKGYKVKQNKHHIYDCYQHNLLSLDYAAQRNFSLTVRLAALLHDIAKPEVKRGEGANATFYGHEIVGARTAKKILERLKFPKEETKKIVNLVRYHLFYYNVDEVSESSVRRLVRQAGKENMEELLQLRACDRIGSGVPKAEPYKLRHLKYIIDKISQDPISVKMLAIKGQQVMDILGISPGKKVGWILEILLDIVLNDPQKNTVKFLEKKVEELGKMSDEKIEKMALKSEQETSKVETKRDQMTKKKYWVA